MQIRYFAGRKDRASTSTETRTPTRKQLKEYHRRRRSLEYEKNKHSRPNSKAVYRRAEVKETTERLVEIALEEEELKQQLSAYYEKVHALQAKIESTPKFQALLQKNTISPEELKAASRHAAKVAADKSDTPHPPLPSWWQDRLTYDWGDALMDDIMGNSADLTSSPSPYPVHMGSEYGRLRRKVEKLIREGRDEVKFLLEHHRRTKEHSSAVLSSISTASSSSLSSSQSNVIGDDGVVESSSSLSLPEEVTATTERSSANHSLVLPDKNIPQQPVPDRLLSDLLRAHRDVHGKRTNPVGLASCLQLLQEIQVPLSALGSSSYVSLLTCCQSVWEGRKVNDLRRQHNVSSNEYFWSALVDIYARVGDYRGAEMVLDEMLDESKLEYNEMLKMDQNEKSTTETDMEKRTMPISIPPLPAYTSFFSACYKLISRTDVHPSIKSDAANRAWARWKEMRIHSVAPDVMAYGALMRIFAAQGRPEQAIDLLDEIMMQMMMPVNADGVLNKNGDEVMLRNADGDEDGWYVDREGNTVRVKPTTLLFTSALRAVAKSHETANKLNGGMSKKNRRRESITSYHGRLARKIVVLAEQAEVRQDDGFVSALMLCAAAAGDSSTARAIYLASKVRRLDHLRTCGGEDHLKRLQGLIPEDERVQLLGGGQGGDSDSPALLFGGGSSNKPALRSIEEEFVNEHEAYEHREYGTDTRILTTLLLAHSKAMETKGLGSMWKGRYNRGYLCPNSLRYLEAYNHPQYENMAIPGLNPSEAGLSSQGWQPEEFDDDGGKSNKQLRKKNKFNIKQITDDMQGNRRDDQDSFFDGFDPDPEDDWRLQMDREAKFEGGREEEVSRDWLQDELLGSDDLLGRFLPAGDGITTMTYQAGQAREGVVGDALDVNNISANFGNEFDSDSDDDDPNDDAEKRRVGLNVHDSFVRKQQRQGGTKREALVQAMAEITNDIQLAEDLIPKDMDLFGANDDESVDEGISGSEDFLDEEEFNKFMEETIRGIDNSADEEAEKLDSIPGIATNDFAAFKTHLKRELVSEGSAHDVNEEEALQLFEMMRTYYDERNSCDTLDDEHLGYNTGNSDSKSREPTSVNTPNISSGLHQYNQEYPVPIMQKSASSTEMPNETLYADDYIEWAKSSEAEFNLHSNNVVSSEKQVREMESSSPIDVALPRQFVSPLAQEDDDAHLIEIQQNLPGLPINRIEKVSDEFARTLGYPSILRLTLAVRENMPESFSPQCLTRVNLTNAKHVLVSLL